MMDVNFVKRLRIPHYTKRGKKNRKKEILYLKTNYDSINWMCVYYPHQIKLWMLEQYNQFCFVFFIGNSLSLFFLEKKRVCFYHAKIPFKMDISHNLMPG